MKGASDPVSVGIVGAGLQAGRRAAAVDRSATVRLVAVASRRLDKAREIAERHGAIPFEHWSQMVAAPGVDAVLICTPPDSHLDIALAALEQKKHVFCEKPLARTSAEARQIVQAGLDAARVVSCGFNHRFHPALATARETLQAGSLGVPHFARCAYGIAGRPGYGTEWRFDPAVVAGGHLAEHGIHAVDLLQWLVGPIVAVAAACSSNYWSAGPLEDNAAALLITRPGVVASLHSSATQWVNLFRLEIGCTDGLLVVEGLGGAYGDESLTIWSRDEGPFSGRNSVFRGRDRSWEVEIAEFEKCIRSGTAPTGVDNHPGVTALRVVEACYEAHERQEWVRP
jgi:predicted dehydrogenase